VQTSVYGFRGSQKEGPDHGEPPNPASVFLNPQKNKAETRQYHQQPELKILAAMQKLVPGPDALRNRHRDSFNSNKK
jgi:hypothetical protein